MKVSLDLHDFSILNNHLDTLLEIKSHYPDFKVSMFAIPFDAPREISTQGRLMRSRELARVKENLDWIQIIPHGLTHMPREFEKCDRQTMRMTLLAIDEAFSKDDLPYEQGFLAPYWLWNQDVVDALDDAGWWGGVDRNQPKMACPERFYQYSHSIHEPFWKSTEPVLKLHGHMDPPSSNALEQCVTNILKLPHDVEWHFVTDFIERKNEHST